MENTKQELIGKVISSTCDKTITIAIETYSTHPLYKKRVKKTKKYAVHDEENKAKVGDIVKVVSCKPLSKTKRYNLVSVIEAKEEL